MRKLEIYTPTRFMAQDSHYDKSAADRAVNFIQCLRHTKGIWAGKKFELIDWQEQIIRDVFGIVKPNGYRQFNTAYIEIPKSRSRVSSPQQLSVRKFDECKVDFDEADLEGRICYGGLDLSSTTDLTAFVLVFPPLNEDDKFQVLSYFWLPEDTIKLRVNRDHVQYDVWARQGFLNVTAGNVVDYVAIEQFIAELAELYRIAEISFDRWLPTGSVK